MKVYGEPTRSIRSLDNGTAVEIVDQTLLPYRFEKRVLGDWRDCVEAIRTMRVRGAPLIGITGAWAVVLAVKENPENDALLKAAEVIANARPTAVNLSWAVRRMMSTLLPRDPALRFEAAVKTAEAMTQEDVMTCRAIGEAGMTLISDLYARLRRPVNVLTHCNAGWLATVDYGTALSPIYMAFEQGTPLHVWVDETRPRDVANKIGTYLKALAAVDNEVPFYVAAPSSTIDWTLNDGKREIPIENRAASELLVVNGVGSDGETRTVQIAAPEVAVANPAFDVTHNRFVTGIITERGIVKPTDLTAVFADLLPKA